MKKIANLTKRKLIRLLKQRCPECLTEDTKREIKSFYEQLKRTNRFKMEVFEKDGALCSAAVPAMPIFITPNDGIPFLTIVNAQVKENRYLEFTDFGIVANPPEEVRLLFESI